MFTQLQPSHLRADVVLAHPRRELHEIHAGWMIISRNTCLTVKKLQSKPRATMLSGTRRTRPRQIGLTERLRSGSRRQLGSQPAAHLR